MKRQHIGQIQEPGLKPRNVSLVVEDNDPLVYKLRHLPVSSSSGTLTLDISEANSYACTLTENVTTVDINGPMVSGQFWEFHLQLTQDTTARTVTWAAKFLFPGGTDHVMSTGSGNIAAVHGYSVDGGATWNCTFVNAFA